MHLTHTKSINRRNRSSRRPERARPVVSAAQVRARRSDGPQDRALYRCGCGYAFKAEVTTSVGCPHCGTAQDW